MRQIKYVVKNKDKLDEILHLILREDFDNDVQRIRKGHSKILFSIKNGFSVQYPIDKNHKNDIDRDIQYMLIRFNLPDSWYNFLKRYILYNDIFPESYDPNIALEIGKDLRGMKKVSLLLNDKTSREDFLKVWPEIRKEFRGKQKAKRRRMPSEFDRDYEIFKLYEQGKSIEEICNLMEQKYGKNLEHHIVKNAVSKIRKMLRKSERRQLKSSKLVLDKHLFI